ncbi:acetyl-CoA carboxylase biotin carboxyl carrier protein [Natranaerobius trueperi]|uniref:Biotin carboxyl carrier protein of acetyl-CoA carboxylase n=1 Tax=Natranaerobius trueperi TaxID=759412 RepID=A0A226BYJ3_9FIRM|nr:acetyl-CoA carboxylase biotin carboxyl carrier protein [Natranaerobius trueperi]OWZ84083.1 acetyl-CoA carboxylase, biotin carboxyl carrier protein [Natranaerobius trueperi]
MDYKEIIKLMKEMNDSDLTKLKIEENNVVIEMEKQNNDVSVTKEKPSLEKTDVETKEVNLDDDDIEIVTAPIVGTFYSAPSPDKEDYVKVGSKVEKGDVLCIVEAMKIMNEIESEVSGEVVEILCANDDSVEYGQELFKIKTS